MKIVLTGATGFIGQHVLPLLQGHELRIISRKEKPADWRFGGTWYQGNITEKDKIKFAFEGADILVNLAAELKEPAHFHDTNILGIKVLVELCKEYSVKKIIHLSSVGVVGMQYSPVEVVVDENTICQPQNGYEKSKFESEKLILAAGNEISAVLLRPTNVFGDNHPRKALLGLLQGIQHNKGMMCAKNAKVNYVYVGDLAKAIDYFIVNEAAKPGIYNVGCSLDFSCFYEMACRLLNKKPHLRIIGKRMLGFSRAVGFFGISKIRHAVQAVSNQVVYSDEKMQGLQKHIYGVEKGLALTIDWYKKKGLLDA